MMFTTHILVGALVGYVLSVLTSPEITTLVLAGMLGGLIPELDFLIGKHRKTLHYPFSYFIFAITLFSTAIFTGNRYMLIGSTILLSTGIHSFMDIFAGAELRSWDRTEWKQTAVYDHLRKKWIKPRRVAYGGSWQDLGISLTSCTTLIYWISDLWLRAIFCFLLSLSFIYSLTIRWFSEKFVGDFSTLNQFIRSRAKKYL